MSKTINANDFSGVPSTLFLVLWAQYLENKTPNGLTKDLKIVEMVESLAYDFSKYRLSSHDLLGVAIRKEIFYREIQTFVALNPNGIVINLGCGLDTHCHHFKDSEITWYDLDLPPVISLRRQFFTETFRHKFISKSVLDLSWTEEIPKNKSTLIIAEGLLPYFQEIEVKHLVSHIINQFNQSELLIHALSPWRIQLLHRELRKSSLKLGWGLSSAKDMENWADPLHLQDEWFIFAQYPRRWSWFIRFLNLFAPFRKQEKIMHWKRPTCKAVKRV